MGFSIRTYNLYFGPSAAVFFAESNVDTWDLKKPWIFVANLVAHPT